jgi:ABC-type transport system involved in multi-copper enzyme maturation permease subunit
MTRLVSTIALNTFREAVRDRVFYNLVLFAVLLVGASIVIGQLAAGQDVKIIKDIGLAAASIFGVGIAIFIGIQLVAREVERRSIYATLSKPVSRPAFLIGKYLGLLLTLGVNIVVMAVALYAVLGLYHYLTPELLRGSWTRPPLDPRLMLALVLIYLELAVVTSIALLFSTYSSALLSASFTAALWLAGHFVTDLRTLEVVGVGQATRWCAYAVSWVLPNLALFDVKAEVVHGLPLAPWHLLYAAAYAVLYVSAVLTLATLVFSRREFK